MVIFLHTDLLVVSLQSLTEDVVRLREQNTLLSQENVVRANNIQLINSQFCFKEYFNVVSMYVTI